MALTVAYGVISYVLLYQARDSERSRFLEIMKYTIDLGSLPNRAKIPTSTLSFLLFFETSEHSISSVHCVKLI